MATIQSYPQAKTWLKILYDALIGYFGKQDQSLLEDLKFRHRDDPHALKMLEFWEVDLKDIKIKIITFFEKYTGEFITKPSGSFRKEFKDIYDAISARFESENSHLRVLLNK